MPREHRARAPYHEAVTLDRMVQVRSIGWVAARTAFPALIALLALVALPAPAAHAAPSSGMSVHAADAPESARVQFLLENVANVNLAAGTFDASFYVGLTCSATCRQVPFEVVNALREQQELVYEDSTASWWKVFATMVFDPQMHDYPFDTQWLPIAIMSTALTSSQLLLVPDAEGSGAALSTHVAGWQDGIPSITTNLRDYPMLDQQYSEARFALPIQRSFLASALTFYLPLSAFLLLGLSVLILKRSDLHIRVAGTGLVGLTIFYLATARSVASQGVLTVWDLSLSVVYLCLALVLIFGIVGANFYLRGRYEGPSGEALEARVRLTALLAVCAVIAIGAAGIPIYALN